MSEPFHGVLGHEVIDAQGEMVGYVDLLFADDSTGQPELIGVWNGVWGTRPRVLVPLEGVQLGPDQLRLPWSKDVVESAPAYDEEDVSGVLLEHESVIHISPEKERAVYEHFGVTRAAAAEPRPMRRRAMERSSG